MKKILTIAVAAYNKENLLPRCLNSLIISPEQMEKVQVLVINDGSKDKTLEVAQRYQELYPSYFTAIDKENGNYGSVMNKAILLAEGKYFRTLDADDWYDTNAYSEFINDLEKTDADMIISQRLMYDANTHKYSIKPLPDTLLKFSDLNPADIDWDDPSIRSNLNVPHITYKTSIIQESGLKWLEKICYTDTMYDFWPLRLVTKVRFVPLNVYIYLTGDEEQSMSPQNLSKNFSHFQQVAQALIGNFNEHKDESTPMYPVQIKFLWQIMSFVYPFLLKGSKYDKQVTKLHKQYIKIPEISKIVNQMSFYGVHYLHTSHSGNLPVIFKILRFISITKRRLFK